MVVGVVSGLVVFAICLLAGFWWRRRKKDARLKNYSISPGPVDCQHVQGKRRTAGSEVMSYPLERHDTAPAPPLNNYAEPAAGSPALGSTFRPGPAQDHAALSSFVQEPEYATPFGEQLPDGRDPPPGAWTGLPPPAAASGLRGFPPRPLPLRLSLPQGAVRRLLHPVAPQRGAACRPAGRRCWPAGRTPSSSLRTRRTNTRMRSCSDPT
ncbi:hypothetical protein N1851_015297 [Merluccius polli]|uniref:Uncharacterized protein n=1 Tax=Merluccius polli TaxID=89951 RepID=A0AA47MTA8_MERPO|nr:hypothetical protein N1851_015297 [Merluccius polli]